MLFDLLMINPNLDTSTCVDKNIGYGLNYHGDLAQAYYFDNGPQAVDCLRWDNPQVKDYVENELFMRSWDTTSSAYKQAENYCRNFDNHPDGPTCVYVDPISQVLSTGSPCNVPGYSRLV